MPSICKAPRAPGAGELDRTRNTFPCSSQLNRILTQLHIVPSTTAANVGRGSPQHPSMCVFSCKKKGPTQQVQRWFALFKLLRKIHHQCAWPICAASVSSKELHLQHSLLMQHPHFLLALLRQHPAKSGTVFAVLRQRRPDPCPPSYRRGQLINWPQNVLSVFRDVRHIQ